jgi:hypothetical protein
MGRKPKLTPHQMREAIKRRDAKGECALPAPSMFLTARFHGFTPKACLLSLMFPPSSR